MHLNDSRCVELRFHISSWAGFSILGKLNIPQSLRTDWLKNKYILFQGTFRDTQKHVAMYRRNTHSKVKEAQHKIQTEQETQRCRGERTLTCVLRSDFVRDWTGRKKMPWKLLLFVIDYIVELINQHQAARAKFKAFFQLWKTVKYYFLSF